MKAVSTLSVVVLLCVATAAFAQRAEPASGTKIGPSNDPQQIVCIRDTELGSRIRFRRVCRTRAEWRDHRRDVRLELDTILHPTN